MAEKEFLKLKEEVKEVTRRIDTLSTQLHTTDSEYGLHQLAELRERLDNLSGRLALDENEFRIFRDVVATLQRDFYRRRPPPSE